jgi:hypothetical protein
MWPYFVIPVFIAVISIFSRGNQIERSTWVLVLLSTVFFVGLRHKVGMDWNNYLIMIERVYYSHNLQYALHVVEPGYAFLLWLSAGMGYGVYGSNLIGTLIFCLGLFRYAQTTPHPWTALLVSMPILVTVVAMSANRQAVAIGVLLWMVAAWSKLSLSRRVASILFAALFHFSAIFFLVFVAADLKARKSVKVVLAGSFLVIMFYILSNTGRGNYYSSLYLTSQNEITRSTGAIFHVILNGGPAALYFLLSRSQRAVLFPSQLYRLMALLALALIPAALLDSAAAGRMSLYLFPVSMYAFSAFPQLVKEGQQREFVKSGVAILMLLILFLWLSFANSSSAHIPYGNFLTIPSFERRLCC